MRDDDDDDDDLLDDFPISFDTFSPQSSSSDEDNLLDCNAASDSSGSSGNSNRSSENDSPWQLMEQIQALDAATGGRVGNLLQKLRERAYAPFPLDDWVVYCALCNHYNTHDTAHHLCHVCHRMGIHKSEDCAVVRDFTCTFCGPAPSAGHVSDDHCCGVCYARGLHATCSPTASSSSSASLLSSVVPREWIFYRCDLCGNHGSLHDTSQHLCRKCHTKGDHRTADCPASTPTTAPAPRSASSTIAAALMSSPPSSYASTVLPSLHYLRSQLHANLNLPTLHSLMQQTMRPSSWTDGVKSVPSLVMNEMEARLRQSLHRLGVWRAGSQTPLSTPLTRSFLASPPPSSSVPMNGDDAPVVVSYREGSSVVPERILKYMRLIMHTQVPTNAFDVVVRANAWEEKRPGMVTPRSFPPSPRTRQRYQSHMDSYTESVVLGARAKLIAMTEQQTQKLAPPL
ncbi:Aste57867_2129 [Aphanomyces stellatus]|uniref:Aste57867_2129 protein n=1 Tax=Aphanomyces stellatus TaxID=120398 RepID=A0A485K7X1_9STRA|nr:hypothetical protein As57867_002124 [Aphanomyces stellatus]VFT79332.1 Aste57867_2129 [Aphanomyces stellatus]